MAVMQLVEEGWIDLDAPAADYLPNSIVLPNRFDRPITVANLMSHSAGFEDRFIGTFTKNAADLPAPEAYFAEFGLPEQVTRLASSRSTATTA